MKKIIYLELFAGIFLLIFGVYSSVVLNNPHFYTPFSIGSFLISLGLYRLLVKKSFFDKWNIRSHIIFWSLLCLACLIVDRIGIALDYWHYPYYSGALDEIIKITLEYAIPLASFAVFAFLVFELINKKLLNKFLSYSISIITTSSLILILTEYVNSFSDSWVVTLPLIIWFTVGAWFMALIPMVIYKIINQSVCRYML